VCCGVLQGPRCPAILLDVGCSELQCVGSMLQRMLQCVLPLVARLNAHATATQHSSLFIYSLVTRLWPSLHDWCRNTRHTNIHICMYTCAHTDVCTLHTQQPTNQNNTIHQTKSLQKQLQTQSKSHVWVPYKLRLKYCCCVVLILL